MHLIERNRDLETVSRAEEDIESATGLVDGMKPSHLDGAIRGLNVKTEVRARGLGRTDNAWIGSRDKRTIPQSLKIFRKERGGRGRRNKHRSHRQPTQQSYRQGHEQKIVSRPINWPEQ